MHLNRRRTSDKLAHQPSNSLRTRIAVVTAASAAATVLAVPPLEASALSGPDAGVAIVAAPGGNGYAVFSASGGQYNYGASRFSGSLAGLSLNAPIVGAAAVPRTEAKWLAAADGGVFSLGLASFYGSMGGQHLNRPISAIVASSTGRGYLLVAQDGGTFAFGDFPSPGSLAGLSLNAPIVAAAATPDNRGVWLVGSDGGVFALGTAQYYGSMGSTPLAAPISAALSSPTGRGYLLVGRDGGTFAFGDYPFPGSLVGTRLNAPIVAAAPFDGRTGVWLQAADGGVFAINAPFYGSASADANTVVPRGSVVTSPGLVSVRCPNGAGSIVVNATLGDSLARLLTDADRAGYHVCGSGYRDTGQQIRLRVQNCGGPNKYNIYDKPPGQCHPPTARPGTSRHERGLAVDFTTTTAGYRWLKANSSHYGLFLLIGGQERWHFSTDGH